MYLHFYFKDCGTPSKTGYTYSDTSGTTYEETSTVSCAIGYEGMISTTSVTCQATGSWTDVTGCSIKGKTIVVDIVIGFSYLLDRVCSIFSGAGKFCPAHGTRDASSDVSCLQAFFTRRNEKSRMAFRDGRHST